MQEYREKNAGISYIAVAILITPALSLCLWGIFFRTNTTAFWLALFPTFLVLPFAPGILYSWLGTELRLDDFGIRFGDPGYNKPLRLGAITRAPYQIPWEAVANPRILPRSRSTIDLTIMSRISRQYNRSDRVVPGYIPSWGTHTLIFDVDITQAEPKAGQFRPLSGYWDLYGKYKGLNPRRSSVWCFPIRNRKKVAEALRRHGFEVTTVHTYKGQGPKWVNTPSPGEYGYKPPA